MTERILTQGSFSRLKDYERCPYMAWLKYGEKRKPDLPLNEKAEIARNRGIQVHNDCELFVKGEGSLTKEMYKFADYFKDLKVEYEAGDVSVEENWGFDAEWQPTGWWDDNVRVRVKLDNFRVVARNEEGEPVAGVPTDYKTGKKFGNEVTHNQQGQLYSISCFLRNPTLEYVDVEFIYLDHGLKSKPKRYTREKAMKMLPMWEQRFQKMFEDREFRPKANKINCKYCDFGPQHGDSSCEWGVDA